MRERELGKGGNWLEGAAGGGRGGRGGDDQHLEVRRGDRALSRLRRRRQDGGCVARVEGQGSHCVEVERERATEGSATRRERDWVRRLFLWKTTLPF